MEGSPDIRLTLVIYIPSGIKKHLLPDVLAQIDTMKQQGRIKLAVNQFLLWRRSKRNPARLIITRLGCDLFPRLQDSDSRLSGESRNLATQQALVYEGASGGFDSIGSWSVKSLGCLCHVIIRTNDVDQIDPDALSEMKCRITNVEVVENLACDLSKFSDHQILMELHKVEAFVSFFLQRAGVEGERWRPFPAKLRLEDSLSGSALRLAKKIYHPEPREIHRGALMDGPAGTGKSSSARSVLRYLCMHCVWGFNEDGDPIIGTGATLKGSLQGDLEMKVLALFMRANAAPWLPTAITVDEIDFTAPSRKMPGSQDSGGNLWLEKLSDDVRQKHVVFIATTNVRGNILEQLVDRLDNIFVGLLTWKESEQAIQKFMKEWPEDMLRDNNRPFIFGKNQIGGDIPDVSFFHAILLGMAPRAMKNLRSLDDVHAVQLNSNPWPTHSWGPISLYSLLSPTLLARTVQSDCGALLRFLLWAQHKNVLSGRILIDLTRLRERIIVVEVEVINDLHVLNQDVLLIDSTQHVHVHAKDRRGRGHCFTRAFVLHEQDNEAGLWATLLRFALSTQSTHCTYVSETFLRSFSGESQAGADERNRSALDAAITQYVSNCDRAVFVMPLSLARIQKPEDSKSSMSSSSNINAHEVFDKITNNWRANEKKNQLFAVVASEEWEIDAVLGSSTIAWQESQYRTHMLLRKEEEQRCINKECGRKYSTRSVKERQGCAHTAGVALYEPGADNQYRVCVKSTPDVVRTRSEANPEIAFRAKWMCCGKPFLEQECPLHNHRKPVKIEKATESRAGGLAHQDVHGRWWCNYCCQVVSENGCVKK